ncbi:MAG: methyl-accepting chemotaxis protein [Anaeromyxobacter sp.]
MPTPRASNLRRKMLLPTAVTVVAALAAGVTTMALSTMRAGQRLAQIESRDYHALQEVEELSAGLEHVHRALRAAAAASDTAALEDVDTTKDALAARFTADAELLGAERTTALKAQLEAYYAHARELARRASHGEATDEQLAELNDTMAAHQKLAEALTTLSQETRATLAAGFGEARQAQRGALTTGALMLAVACVLGAGLAWWVGRTTAKPLRRLNEVTLKIAEGDLTLDVPVGSSDEVGELAGSFRRMVERLRDIVGTLKQSSQELGSAAEQLSELTWAQGGLLERQASGVAETSTTTHELEQTSAVAATRAASVLDVARRAASTSETGRIAAEKSVEELRRIQASVEAIVGQSTRLFEQARQVGDIVETVRDLATQSNVLSLNAAVEAARAGQAGEDFGQVASEVRALAEQSSSAAGKISHMVQDILEAVQSTLDITVKGSQRVGGSLAQVAASGDSLREIGEIVRETSDAALHIASAVEEQSTGIRQIALAMRDLEKGMEETVGRLRSLQESAQQVGETATRISGIAEGFKV